MRGCAPLGNACARKPPQLQASPFGALIAKDSEAQLCTAIGDLLRRCDAVILMAPGEQPLLLESGAVRIRSKAGAVRLEACCEDRRLSWTLTALLGSEADCIKLRATAPSGGKTLLYLGDAASLAAPGLLNKGRRLAFAARFRKILAREFPGWRIVRCSTESYLEESLPQGCARALLRRGPRALAAIALPPGGDDSRLLGYGLIWLDYLRRSEKQAVVEGAAFLPQGQHWLTCSRMEWLDPQAARWLAFCYDDRDQAEPLEFGGWGNRDTELPAPAEVLVGEPSPRLRSSAEAELEWRVRRHLPDLDCRLRPAPVYSQLPALSAGERSIPDLLALTEDHRLAVIELKAAESIHLPMQALDYWIEVRRRLERGEFSARGYFPGIVLNPAPPRLILVAPALRFHSTNERLLRYFHPAIEVDRIGVDTSGLGPPRVLFRQSRSAAG